jgi:hypothetical protein
MITGTVMNKYQKDSVPILKIQAYTMKFVFVVILTVLSQQYLFSQVIKVQKTDDTTVEFKLSEIDSITFSAIGKTIPVTADSWEGLVKSSSVEYIEPAAGVYEQTTEGIKIYSAGLQSVASVHPLSLENDAEVKSVCLKWKAAASGSAAVSLDLYTGSGFSSSFRLMNYTLNEAENSWHYTRVIISNGTAAVITSSGNYDVFGGNIEQTGAISLTGAVNTFTIGITGGTESFLLLGEAGVE